MARVAAPTEKHLCCLQGKTGHMYVFAKHKKHNLLKMCVFARRSDRVRLPELAQHFNVQHNTNTKIKSGRQSVRKKKPFKSASVHTHTSGETTLTTIVFPSPKSMPNSSEKIEWVA